MYEGTFGFWQQIRDWLDVRYDIKVANEPGKGFQTIIQFNITNIAKGKEPDIVFEEVLLRIGKESKWHVEKFNNLEAGDSITYQYSCDYIELPDIYYDIEYRVSLERLFGFRRASKQITIKPSEFSILDYLRAVNGMRIHKWLDAVLKKMPVSDSGTTLGEVKEQQNKIKALIEEIRDTEKRIAYIFDTVGKAERDEIVPLANLLKGYVRTTENQCKQSLEAPVSKGIGSGDICGINVLEQAARNINKKIEEIMERNGISDEDAGYQYRGW